MKNSQLARLVAEAHKVGTLATQSLRHKGYPFASLTPYVLDDLGNPLFLISGLAIHTRNLAADGRASLLIFDDDSLDDPMTGTRLTLMGQVTRAGDDERDALKPRYLNAHPSAAQWFDFRDFAIYRLTVEDVYIVAGFGTMGWVLVEDYRAVSVS